MRDRARPAQQRGDGQLPALAELAREPLSRVMAALEHALTLGRDEGQRGDARPLDARGDEIRRLGRQPSETALLPAGDEAPDPLVVLDRRARGGEREAAAGALAAAAHGPRGRRPTPLAERRSQQRQALAAARAQLLSARSADDAANRQ